METRHTPGPWRIGDGGATVFGPRTNAPSPRTIANVGRGPLCTNETKANARLIAAAPELLAALDRVLPWLGKLISDGGHLQSVCPNDAIGALQQAEAALARAKGE